MPEDALFAPAQTTAEMASATGDQAWLAAMLEFEAALAEASAKVGLISPEAAAAIAGEARAGGYEAAEIGRQAEASATPVLPLVEALRERLPAAYAGDVHRGATSQDCLDTALMLVAREALAVLDEELAGLANVCAELAERHQATAMAGRTLLQQAVPITFGLKAAGWLLAVDAAWARLRQIGDERLALQLGGAAGTLDGFGGRGLEVRAELGRRLGLTVPPLAWHADRTRVAELGAALGIAAGVAAKIALDVLLLAQTEVAEVSEPAPGRSTAMPHKRNPVSAVEARAAAAGAQAQAGLLLQALAGEHERSGGAWQSEWTAVGAAFRLTAGAVAHARASLTGIHVDQRRMQRNLGLGPGREADTGQAEELVEDALRRWRSGSRSASAPVVVRPAGRSRESRQAGARSHRRGA